MSNTDNIEKCTVYELHVYNDIIHTMDNKDNKGHCRSWVVMKIGYIGS